MKRIGCIGMALLAAIFIFAAPKARAEVLPGFKSMTPGALIGQITDNANRLLGNASNDGNALVAKTANELNVLAENVRVQFADMLGKKISDLKDIEIQALQPVYDFLVQVKDIQNTAYDLENIMAIDLERIVSQFPGAKEGDYLIRRVTGLTQFMSPNHQYAIEITGRGLSAPTDSLRSDIAIELNGALVSGIKFENKPPYTTVAYLPAPAVEPLFRQKKMNTVPLKVTVTYTITKKRLGVFKHVHVKQSNLNMHLVLMSDYAGTLSIVTKVPERAWRLVVKDFPVERRSGDHHCSSNCGNQPTLTHYDVAYVTNGGALPVVGNRMLANPRLGCVAGPCPWSSADRAIITENGMRATGYFSVWSWACTYRLTVDIYEYQVTGNKPLAETSYDLYFGKNTRIEVPSDYVSMKITGSMVNYTKVDLELGQQDQLNRVTLVAIKGDSTGPTKEIVLSVKPPTEWRMP